MMNKNRSVLVISDSHEQFSLTASMLRDRGYSVNFEKNIGMSLEKARNAPPKLIISELAGPDIDGLKLCWRVRGDVDLAATPVLLVGDLSKQSSIVSDSLRCGAADYLQKPVDPVELFRICRDMVDPMGTDPSDAGEKINECGSWMHIVSTGTPIDDPQLGSAVAITSREMSQNKISLANFIEDDFVRTALFDDASARMALFSPSGRILASNSALRRMFDHSEADLRGAYLSDFICPQNGENDKLAIVDLMCGKRSQFQFQNGYIASTGERVWGQLNIGAIRDADGRTQFLLGIFDEPTTADQVRPSEQKFDPTCSKISLPELDRCHIDYGLISEN